MQLFAFDEEVKVHVDDVMHQIPAETLRLGVHIRRGDYRTWQGGKYYYTDEQYLSVIRQFLSLYPEQQTVIYICGNDPELDQEKFRQALSGQTVVFPEGNPAEDMYLLSCCDYLMGAPSTFTLVASMYHDTPLYWIKDPQVPLTESAFGHFDDLFQQII